MVCFTAGVTISKAKKKERKKKQFSTHSQLKISISPQLEVKCQF
jgi:hypothetical protein